MKIWQVSILLVLGYSLAGLLPDHPIDSWGVFNPHKYALVILVLASFEFFSFIVVRYFKPTKGVYLIGFFGGLVSSTAVLLSAAKQANKTPDSWRTQVSLALAAKLAALLELIFIVGVISSNLLVHFLWIVVPAIIIGVSQLILLDKKNGTNSSQSLINAPLDIKGVLKLSIFLISILIAIAMAKKYFGESGSLIISFLTGLFELHGVTLAISTMFQQNAISETSAIVSIALACIASMIAKIVLSWAIQKGSFAKGITVAFLPMIVVILVAGMLILKIKF